MPALRVRARRPAWRGGRAASAARPGPRRRRGRAAPWRRHPPSSPSSASDPALDRLGHRQPEREALLAGERDQPVDAGAGCAGVALLDADLGGLEQDVGEPGPWPEACRVGECPREHARVLVRVAGVQEAAGEISAARAHRVDRMAGERRPGPRVSPALPPARGVRRASANRAACASTTPVGDVRKSIAPRSPRSSPRRTSSAAVRWQASRSRRLCCETVIASRAPSAGARSSPSRSHSSRARRPGALGLGRAPAAQRHQVGAEGHLQLQLGPVALVPLRQQRQRLDPPRQVGHGLRQRRASPPPAAPP